MCQVAQHLQDNETHSHFTDEETDSQGSYCLRTAIPVGPGCHPLAYALTMLLLWVPHKPPGPAPAVLPWGPTIRALSTALQMLTPCLPPLLGPESGGVSIPSSHPTALYVAHKWLDEEKLSPLPVNGSPAPGP